MWNNDYFIILHAKDRVFGKHIIINEKIVY